LTAGSFDVERHEIIPVIGQRSEDILSQRRPFWGTWPAITPNPGEQFRRSFRSRVVLNQRFKLSGNSLDKSVLQDGHCCFCPPGFFGSDLILPLCEELKIECFEVSELPFGFQSFGCRGNCLQES